MTIHQQFEAVMNSGAPIVDNASTRLWGPNGEPDDQPERPDGECGFCGGLGVVDDGDRLCPVGCWKSAPCTVCHGAGGWQQPDGLIVECPRGCMTGGSTPASCGSCEHSLAWHVQPGGCTIGDCPCLGGAA